MNLIETALPGVLILEPVRHGDHRGFFMETWSKAAFADAGLDLDFCQDNHSRSAEAGTVRGLHFQSPPFAQDKLVRVTRGRVVDVAVDIRTGSPDYGRHVAVELSEENARQLLVPKGFAHGFATLVQDCEVQYKVTAPYAPANDHGLQWDDPALGIEWGVSPAHAVLSEKDRHHPGIADLPEYFAWEAESG